MIEQIIFFIIISIILTGVGVRTYYYHYHTMESRYGNSLIHWKLEDRITKKFSNSEMGRHEYHIMRFEVGGVWVIPSWEYNDNDIDNSNKLDWTFIKAGKIYKNKSLAERNKIKRLTSIPDSSDYNDRLVAIQNEYQFLREMESKKRITI